MFPLSPCFFVCSNIWAYFLCVNCVKTKDFNQYCVHRPQIQSTKRKNIRSPGFTARVFFSFLPITSYFFSSIVGAFKKMCHCIRIRCIEFWWSATTIRDNTNEKQKQNKTDLNNCRVGFLYNKRTETIVRRRLFAHSFFLRRMNQFRCVWMNQFTITIKMKTKKRKNHADMELAQNVYENESLHRKQMCLYIWIFKAKQSKTIRCQETILCYLSFASCRHRLGHKTDPFFRVFLFFTHMFRNSTSPSWNGKDDE